MTTKIQQILKNAPRDSVLFGSWLSRHGLDARGQHSYVKSGWLDHITRGVYKVHGTTLSLLSSVSAYNNQLGKRCIVGAYTALEMHGYSHYVSIGKPRAFLFTCKDNRLPAWLLNEEWDMNISYMITSFLGNGLLGVDSMTINDNDLLVSSPERAILECLNMPDASASLLDIYYIMESMTTLRPSLIQSLLELCSSNKVKRLFLYMAEKANHRWFKALNVHNINLGTSRLMVTPTGKYISKYKMTIPKELAEYE